MCLACGYYNGRQVLDLEAEKMKRDARIQAKRERISAEAGVPAPEKNEVVEENAKEVKPKKVKEAKKEVEKGAK